MKVGVFQIPVTFTVHSELLLLSVEIFYSRGLHILHEPYFCLLEKLMRALHTKTLIARHLHHVQSVSSMDYFNRMLLIFKICLLI
jgi:hypothetical protein